MPSDREARVAAPAFSSGYGMETCPTHHRWTKIERADGTTAERRCPECPRPRGARIINQFTREVVGRMPPELIEEAR